MRRTTRVNYFLEKRHNEGRIKVKISRENSLAPWYGQEFKKKMKGF